MKGGEHQLMNGIGKWDVIPHIKEMEPVIIGDRGQSVGFARSQRDKGEIPHSSRGKVIMSRSIEDLHNAYAWFERGIGDRVDEGERPATQYGEMRSSLRNRETREDGVEVKDEREVDRWYPGDGLDSRFRWPKINENTYTSGYMKLPSTAQKKRKISVTPEREDRKLVRKYVQQHPKNQRDGHWMTRTSGRRHQRASTSEWNKGRHRGFHAA